MKKLLPTIALLFTTAIYSQIGFQEHEVTSFSPSSSGNVMADIDNDGDLDIVTYGNSTIYWFEKSL